LDERRNGESDRSCSTGMWGPSIGERSDQKISPVRNRHLAQVQMKQRRQSGLCGSAQQVFSGCVEDCCTVPEEPCEALCPGTLQTSSIDVQCVGVHDH
jgi:hypothetical protein